MNRLLLKSESFDKLRIFSVTLLILIVPFTIYYMFYVRNQTTYFTNRALRALSLLSNQLGTKIQNLGDVYKNTGEQFLTPSREGKTSQLGIDYSANGATNKQRMSDLLNSVQEGRQQFVITDFKNPDRLRITDEKPCRSSVTLQVKREADSEWLYLDFVCRDDHQHAITIQAKTNLNALVLPMLSKEEIESYGDAEHEKEFGNILIAGGAPEYRIIFQEDPTEFHIISLDKIMASSNSQPGDVGTFANTSRVVDATIAGSDFKLFIHPFSLAINQTGEAGSAGNSWIVCGMVPLDRFQRAAWSISYSVLIVFVSILALTVLSWPFFKLILIGPKERLRTADVYFLFFSVLIALSLLTFVGLYVFTYRGFEQKMDAQLDQLSGSLLINVNDELKECLAELKMLDHAGEKDLASVMKQDNSHHSEAQVTKQGQSVKDLLVSQPYPYFGSAVWIDPNGKQRIKWTQGDYTTQLISVASRPYFTNLREGRYRYYAGEQFWLEPILSRTTGRREVEISRQLPNSKWVSAFDTRMISLMDPVLPIGFGYCIVNSNGTVLFHSDERHLDENFFRECDDDPYVQSAVLDRTKKELDVRYLGKGYRIATMPLATFPNWSLIVFRDKQPLRTTFLEILTLSTLLFVVYSLVLLVALSAFYLLNVKTNERRAWVWPAQNRTFGYYISIVILTGLTIVATRAILATQGITSVLIAYFFSFIGIGIYFANLKLNYLQRKARFIQKSRLWKESYRLRQRLNRKDLTYTLNFALLLVLIANLPALAFFKFAYDSQVKLFIQHGQLTIADGLVARDERIRSSNPRSRKSDYILCRLQLQRDVYGKFFFDTNIKGPDDDRVFTDKQETPGDWLLSRLAWLVPPFNHNSVVKQGLLSNAFADGSRGWQAPAAGADKLLLRADAGAPDEGRVYHLDSQVSRFPPLALMAAVVFLIGFAAFYFWLLLIIRKIFLLGVHKPAGMGIKHLLARPDGTNLFVIFDGPFTDGGLINDKLHVIDLTKYAKDPEWLETFDYSSLPRHKPIAVTQFEYEYTEPHVNIAKIRFLERLSNWRVIIFSRTRPDAYSFIRKNLNRLETPDGWRIEEFADRWSMLMSQFRTVYIEDDGDPALFEVEVNRKSQASRSSDKKRRMRKQLREPYATLKKECACKAPLQSLAIGMLDEPGFSRLTKEHLINRIAKQSHTYYDNLWESCSQSEKITLFNLAQDRLLSPQDVDVEPLMRRGLIVRNPDLHLMNESFRRFVKLEKGKQMVAHYRTQPSSRWRMLKLPFLIALVTIVIFLFITQRDMYNLSLAVITAAATSIPAFFKLLSLFQEDPSTQLLPEPASGRRTL